MPHEWNRSSGIPIEVDAATLVPGINLEVFLFEETKFDNDRGPAGSCDPVGYRTPEKPTDKSSGIRVTGIVSEVQAANKRLFLTTAFNDKTNQPAWRNGTHTYYVEFGAIHSYRTR